MSGIRRELTTSLDGAWEFRLEAGGVADVAADTDADTDWTVVDVPSLWTMDPRFGRPHYTNVPMPFPEVPPQVPAVNPVGVYRRTFDWAEPSGKRLVLHVGAAVGCLTVIVNDVEIGTSTDSHLAAEFDVTEVAVAGANRLELRVAAWSAESYLEDQDHWWQHGLSRSVGLIERPTISLDDLVVVSDYDHVAQTGFLRVTAISTDLADRADTGHTVRVTFLEASYETPVSGRFVQPSLPRGKAPRSVRPEPRLPEDFMDMISIRAASAPVPPEFRAMPNAFGQAPIAASPAGTAIVTVPDLAVSPWSAETPKQYRLAVELLGPQGEVVDVAELRVGFRRVEVVGRDLLVNGARILIQGVNRHDSDPWTGRVMSEQRMRDELALLKRSNVNAIRTSHYPNDPFFLDLCDEYGFYVVDEADIEGHAFASTIADDPRYLTAIVERVQRMVTRDRNRACVIVWSLGNETGYGAAHDAAAAWVRHADSTRPVQYEGAVSTDWHGGHAATDIVCAMYPSFASLVAYSSDPRADRPMITCEYAYSQGNSTGGLAEYWRLFESLPGLQGGFIWQFLDHSLDRDHNGRFRYGGDFGDVPNDGAVVLNGLAFSDLTPKPALLEARGLFSPIRIVATRQSALQVQNRQSFAALDAYVIEARVESRDGEPVVATLDVPDVLAGASAWIHLPDLIIQAARSADALAITLIVRLRTDLAWGRAGTEIAAVQTVLEPRTPAELPVAARPVVAQEDLGHALLAAAPRLCLWRAMTDNDQSFALDQRFVRSGFFDLRLEDEVETQSEVGTVRELTYRAAFGDIVKHRRRLTTDGDGTFVCTEDVVLPEGTRDGLRVGIEFELVPGFDEVDWVGLGPWENYSDRAAAALLGRWSASVDDMSVPYLRPSENGTRGGVTDARIWGPSGSVRLRATSPMHLSVSRNSVAQLEAADHWWELPADRSTFVHLDIAHRGVGTALLGPDTLAPHRLVGHAYSWRWSLSLGSS